MKKYLMTGMAAIMFCGVFTSCSRESDFGGQTQQEKIQATYEEAFKTRFGEPAANQDWGFGSSRANTRAEDKRLNEWGDPAKNDGTAWDIPPALSDEQKLRVRLYFQYNPYLTYKDPELTDFFVQQVYKGNPLTAGPNSPESYYRVNGEKFTGSDEMDHLVCGSDTHINDFNNGEWNLGVAYEVLNTGANANDHQGNTTHVEGVTHPDQITLMVGSSTEYIGYGASTVEGAKRRDCCALASAKAIDDWVDSDEAKALGITDFGDPVYDPAWNRSFVGLDYEAMKKADALSTESVKALDLKEDGVDFVLYQGNFISINSFTDFVLIDKDGNEVKFVSDNVSNEAVGQKMKVKVVENGQEVEKDVTKSTFKKKEARTVLEERYHTTIQGNNDIWYYDLDMVMDYINDGCNPTKTDKNMIKNIGGRDYVYSDWIVTLTEAKKVGDNPKPDTVIEKLRVIAEDLSVGERTDFDFNDVVFDVIWTRVYSDEAHTTLTSQTVQITLLAAGGTLPLFVDGQEVHDLFDVDQHTMVNTNALLNGMNGKDDAEPVTWTTTNYSGTTIGEIANSIVVYVMKNNEPCYLSAPVGAIASKIGVGFINGVGYQWCDEREDIDHRYSLADGTSLFRNWVQGIYPAPDWYNYAYNEIDKYKKAKEAAQAAANGTNP